MRGLLQRCTRRAAFPFSDSSPSADQHRAAESDRDGLLLETDAVFLVALTHGNHREIVAASFSNPCHIVLTLLSLASFRLRPVSQTQHTARAKSSAIYPACWYSREPSITAAACHFQDQLGMAIGSLQKRGIPMPCHFRHCLFVHTMVQARCGGVVPEGARVVFLRKLQLLADHSRDVW